MAIEGPNAKLESLLGLLEELPREKKVIIWARYVSELRMIAQALGRANCVMYWGEVAAKDRNDNIDRFMTESACRYFVGNTKVGKYGFTLTAAEHVVYFSNDFSAEARWQSEDRVHRIGQTKSVTITDLMAVDTIDQPVLDSLNEKRQLAEFFKNPDPVNFRDRLLEMLT